jgi:hypothetical protein
MVLLAPSGHGAAPLAGFLVDEWVEVVPEAAQTTGLAFNFDRPNTEAPQVLILAVPPGPAWSWEDLVQTVFDTMQAAKRRLVVPTASQDPDELPDDSWDHASLLLPYLPMTMAPLEIGLPA